VRCLVRAGSDEVHLRGAGVEVVRGDLTDHTSLPAACDGVEIVVATATVIGRRLAGARRPSIRDVDEVGMAALVAAAEQAAVNRFVYTSYAGADAGLGMPLEHAKMATEQRLARSPMRAVIVRPDAFQDIHLAPIGRFDMRLGKVAVFGHGDTPRRWVSAEDVAALIAAIAVEPDPPALLEFGGPEELSRNEAVAVAEHETGRTFKRQRMPRLVARAAIRILARPNDALASVFGTGLLQDLTTPRWDDAPLRERGIDPRSSTAFIQEQARALA
jgi:uncharacterized protein YbjT (DUF2867 family)